MAGAEGCWGSCSPGESASWVRSSRRARGCLRWSRSLGDTAITPLRAHPCHRHTLCTDAARSRLETGRTGPPTARLREGHSLVAGRRRCLALTIAPAPQDGRRPPTPVPTQRTELRLHLGGVVEPGALSDHAAFEPSPQLLPPERHVASGTVRLVHRCKLAEGVQRVWR